MTDTDHDATNGTGARPWWASDGPVGRGPDPREDPVEVHRAARRGAALDDAQPWWAGPAMGDGVAADDPVGDARAPGSDTDVLGDADAPDAAAEPDDVPDAAAWTHDTTTHDAADGTTHDAADGTTHAADHEPTTGVHRPELCGICPICTGFRALEELRPDLVTHLSEAARHLAAAFRALAETTSPPPTRERDPDSAPPPVQHIDLD